MGRGRKILLMNWCCVGERKASLSMNWCYVGEEDEKMQGVNEKRSAQRSSEEQANKT